MPSPTFPAVAQAMRALFKKRWIRICSFLVLFCAAFLLALPLAMKKGMESWLLNNGADQALIEHLSFNPFLGRLVIQDMRLGTENRKVYDTARFALDFSFLSLLQKKIHIKKAEYHKVALDIEQLPDGRWRLASYTITPQPEELAPVQTVEQPSDWNFFADQILLSDCTIHLKTPQVTVDLRVEKADLERFTTLADDKNSAFSFKGAVNGAPLSLKLGSISITPGLYLKGEYTVSGLALKSLAGLLKETFPTFAGTVGGSGHFLVDMDEAQDLKAEYSGSLNLDGLELAAPKLLADGELSIKGKSFSLNGPLSLQTGKTLAVSSTAAVRLAGWKVGLPGIQLEEQEAQWQGSIRYAPDKAAKGEGDGRLSTDGDLTISGLQVGMPQNKLLYKQDQISLKGKSETLLATHIQSSFDGGLQLKGLDFASPQAVSKDAALGWQGAFRYADADGKGQRINLKGALNGNGLSLLLPENQLTINQDTLHLQMDGSLTLAQKPALAAKGDLQGGKFQLRQGKTEAPLLTADKLSVDFSLSSGPSLASKKILVQGLGLRLEEGLPQQVTIPGITVSGLDCKNMANFTARSVTVNGLDSVSLRTKQKIGGFTLLTLERPQFSPEQGLRLPSLVLDELIFLPSQEQLREDNRKRKQDVLQLGQATLSDLKWDERGGAQAQSLILDNLLVNINREKDGQLRLQKQLAAMQPPAASGEDRARRSASGRKAAVKPTDKVKPKESATSSKAGNFALKTLQVRGESTIRFRDLSLEVPFTNRTDIQTLKVTDINPANPAQATSFTLKATSDKRAPLEIKGTAKPFLKEPEVNSTIALKNFPLSQLSAYTVQTVGVGLASGQLNLNSTLGIKNQAIDMKNTVLLQKLETKTIAKDLARKLDNQLPLPLDTAISFLKDSNGNITLDVPISGPLASLNVGISDILITALGKAIVPAASSYLMYALGPYGALAYVGVKLGEKMMQTSLAPVVFATGQAKLTAEHKTYLDRIAKILKERPKMEITACPVVPAWEALPSGDKNAPRQLPEPDQKDRRSLSRLGQQRAQAVVDYLVTTRGIDQNRLMICETSISLDGKAAPIVNLQL